MSALRKTRNGTQRIAPQLQSLAVPIASVNPDLANARKHGTANLDAIKQSLARFGQRSPIVVQKEGMIVRAGNGRLVAARELGWTEIAAVIVDESAVEATAFALADNRTAELATWDDDALRETIKALRDDDVVPVGWDDGELERIVRGINGEAEQDEVPSLPAAGECVTQLGDLWSLGEHRLLCGDATSADDVGKVASAPCVLCLTDPPYSVNYDRSRSERGGLAAAHDSYREADVDPAALLAFIAWVPSDVMVWTYPIDRHFQALAAAYREHGWEMRRELVWVKSAFSFWPSANYQQKHEPIMVAARKGSPVGGYVPANATTVLEHDKPHAHEVHPTARPVSLWGALMSNHTALGDTVYDPFLGSGTTIVAAEQLGRACYGLEIEPRYCDVIVRRWEALTGKKADRKNAKAAV